MSDPVTERSSVLPVELLLKIFYLLEVNEVHIASRVCKLWRALMLGEQFWKNYAVENGTASIYALSQPGKSYWKNYVHMKHPHQAWKDQPLLINGGFKAKAKFNFSSHIYPIQGGKLASYHQYLYLYQKEKHRLLYKSLNDSKDEDDESKTLLFSGLEFQLPNRGLVWGVDLSQGKLWMGSEMGVKIWNCNERHSCIKVAVQKDVCQIYSHLAFQEAHVVMSALDSVNGGFRIVTLDKGRVEQLSVFNTSEQILGMVVDCQYCYLLSKNELKSMCSQTGTLQWRCPLKSPLVGSDHFLSLVGDKLAIETGDVYDCRLGRYMGSFLSPSQINSVKALEPLDDASLFIGYGSGAVELRNLNLLYGFNSKIAHVPSIGLTELYDLCLLDQNNLLAFGNHDTLTFLSSNMTEEED